MTVKIDGTNIGILPNEEQHHERTRSPNESMPQCEQLVKAMARNQLRKRVLLEHPSLVSPQFFRSSYETQEKRCMGSLSLLVGYLVDDCLHGQLLNYPVAMEQYRRKGGYGSRRMKIQKSMIHPKRLTHPQRCLLCRCTHK